MRMIGRYEILGRLGKGGMGAVYKARLPELGRVVALKLLDPFEHMVDLLGMDAIAEEFLKEARIMADLNHPHIAGVWDFGWHQGKPYFVMEYVCDNLGSIIGEDYIVEEPSRRLRPDNAVAYTLQVLDALSALHHHGIVHRDVKPFNILITLHDSVKLIDFGLSKLRNELDPQRPPNMMVGSPYYTAPEQERDPDAATQASDMFSVGVMLYRFITGVLPPHVGGPENGSGPQQLFPGVMGPEWDRFFDQAMAPRQQDRFADCMIMSDALEKLYNRYRENMDAACTLVEDVPAPDCATTPRSFRSKGMKTGPRTGLEHMGLTRLGKPRQCVANDFESGNGVVLDRATGLMWERGGSRFPVHHFQAGEHISEMNTLGRHGFHDWRLPTVSELATLIDPRERLDAFCVDPVFDTRQHRLWSADRRTYLSSWTLNAAMGYIGYHDHTCRLYVRCVRTAASKEDI